MHPGLRHYYYYSGSSETDTTTDNEQVFLVVGDSNADGRGDTIPVVGADTLHLWNGTDNTEITTQSVANDDNTKGSIWQQFATDYKSATGKKTILVNEAIGGSEFYPNADTINWYTSGTLYDPAVAAAEACLSANGLNKLKGIFINLGINDLRAGTSTANITLGVNSLISRLTTDFPNVPILMIQIGRSESVANSAAYYAARTLLFNTAEANENVHLVGSAASFIGVTGAYKADNLHYTQDTNNTLGSQLARWFANDSYSKWGRSIIASQFDDLSSARKTLIDTFITSQYANGNFLKLEQFSLFKTTTENNTLIDWAFKWYNVDAGSDFVANSAISGNGTTAKTFATGFDSSFTDAAISSQNDLVFAVKLKAKTTASGTAAVLIGRTDASGHTLRLAQSTSFVNYHHNVASATQRDTADATFTANTLYGVARNGGTEYCLKNKTILNSFGVVSSGNCSGNFRLFALNNNGATQFPFNGSAEYFLVAKYSDFNYDSFYDDVETLIANW